MKNFFRQFGKKQLGQTQPEQTAQTTQSSPLRWIIDRRLAVGPLPTAQNSDFLVQAEIRSVLTFCATTEGTLDPKIPEDYQWQRLVLPDSHYSEKMQPQDLGEVIDQLRQFITTDPPVYVHCLAGMERSPTVCIGYLCLYEGMELSEALNFVKQRNPRTNINPEQVQVLQALIQGRKA
jgi:atypical dual specificity phosphatase